MIGEWKINYDIPKKERHIIDTYENTDGSFRIVSSNSQTKKRKKYYACGIIWHINITIINEFVGSEDQ